MSGKSIDSETFTIGFGKSTVEIKVPYFDMDFQISSNENVTNSKIENLDSQYIYYSKNYLKIWDYKIKISQKFSLK